ncbi:dihydrofolate synthase / folylpolyglutamate synthase [Pustulibacterium marinum]|uniref:Dihydrofolate synthase/folylpolyglutamate synthase n=1 Tax=Pustulibacterium marinum TaxID=1224947 RepID=A0A1I7F4E7_9FLAO|nr:folylpolyglutamate synthase/dihydrofolate synthase family protein [Pustulibacterium marinum]SFU31057.1 dihydrofolate synthase / folylpolyglutamate synthase [Pustulibacterium marinum]
MNYSETLHWLFNQLPMYQMQGASALKHKLDNILNLSAHLGNPHTKFKSVHVAGTNGKGSSSHMLASILQEAGYKVGLYTSPHLKDFRERIKINGISISEEEVIRFVENHKSFFEVNQLSFFEMTVGMAFDYFANQEVDVAIIEVGLGGRLDSTNIITPLVSLITNIGFDHMDILGDTLEKIAAEKAGIIKPNVPVVVSEYQRETEPVFKRIANENNAPIIIASETLTTGLKSDLKGVYQEMNIKGVLATVNVLKKSFLINDSSIKNGLLNVVNNTGLLGRWQILNESPKVVCDTAHNKDGLSIITNQLKKENYNTLHLVLGFVKDKKLEGILPLFPVEATYYFACPNVPRGLDAEYLKNVAENFNLIGKSFSSVELAYNTAFQSAKKNDFIYVGGSTFVVAEII